ncbi:MAG: TIGR00730 family Rossman fold protein [Bauldia sp.]
MTLRNLCVYCGAATGTDPDHAAAAERLGRLMAEAGIGLVYGGGSVGLMGILARAALENGGHVTGIIPQFLKDREIMLGEASELVITADMHERKRLMFDRSDAFLALPGGIGTLEETIEMMTWAQLGQHRKPIVLANFKGFWAPLIALLEHMTIGGFVHSSPAGRLYTVVDRIEDVLPTQRSLTPRVGVDDPGAAALM